MADVFSTEDYEDCGNESSENESSSTEIKMEMEVEVEDTTDSQNLLNSDSEDPNESANEDSDLNLKQDVKEPELFVAEDLLVNPDDLLPPVVKLEKYANSDIVFNRGVGYLKTTGMCSRRHGRGRVRSTTPAEDRYIVLSAKRKRRTTAQQVANQFLAASGKQISRKTVARRLRGGLYARRPVVCVPLTRQHRTARLQWCREHHNWTEQDWACVLFSDESRFSLSSDCRRQLI
ncbi:transposable element Tcb1 transposase [Trichonephila clavipes]|nr:transposable element Tcb1 transposase [Trichonephila clavipes]